MLLHSHGHGIRLLPALPFDRWPNGQVTGLRARGDYTVDISWQDGQLKEASITAGPNSAGTLPVHWQQTRTAVSPTPGTSVTLHPHDFKPKTNNEDSR